MAARRPPEAAVPTGSRHEPRRSSIRNSSALLGCSRLCMAPYLPNIPSSSRGTASSQKCPLGRTTPDNLRERRDSQPSVQAGFHTLHASYRDSMKKNGDVPGPNSAPPQVSRFHVKREPNRRCSRVRSHFSSLQRSLVSGRRGGLLIDSCGES